jgi:PEP-CTERM motif
MNRNIRRLAAASLRRALGLALAAAAAPAAASLVHFEADGLGNPVVLGAQWYDDEISEAYANLGVHFYNAYFKPCLANACPQPSPGLFASSGDYSSALTIRFDGGTSFIGASNVSGSAWTMSAFDDANVFIGSVDSLNSPGSVELHLPGIYTVAFQAKDAGELFGFDDLAFQASDTPTIPSPVPEPGSWALMLAGLLAVGAVTSRRRRAALSPDRLRSLR